MSHLILPPTAQAAYDLLAAALAQTAREAKRDAERAAFIAQERFVPVSNPGVITAATLISAYSSLVATLPPQIDFKDPLHFYVDGGNVEQEHDAYAALCVETWPCLNAGLRDLQLALLAAMGPLSRDERHSASWMADKALLLDGELA